MLACNLTRAPCDARFGFSREPERQSGPVVQQPGAVAWPAAAEPAGVQHAAQARGRDENVDSPGPRVHLQAADSKELWFGSQQPDRCRLHVPAQAKGRPAAGGAGISAAVTRGEHRNDHQGKITVPRVHKDWRRLGGA